MKCFCLALLALFCSACTTFENPVVAEGGPALDPALIGHWTIVKDEGRLELVVSRNGAEGKAIVTSTGRGEKPETDEFRLITARIDRHTFASVLKAGKAAASWQLFRYELSAPDRLTIYSGNERFWMGAVENRQVSGRIEGTQLRTVIVTASSAELRAFVQGYGAVIFNGEPLGVLTRE